MDRRCCGAGGIDHIEKDASLFPESRVRPWVVDEDSQRLVEETLGALEKTLAFVSPVKVGVGASPLDRVLQDDRGADMFLAKLAALETQQTFRPAQFAPDCGDLPAIGEVFEDFHRETHGLPPRPRPAANRVVVENALNVTINRSQQTTAAGIAQDTKRALSKPTDDEVDGLATDPDVVRLLTELQEEFHVGCSSGSEGGIGSKAGATGGGVEVGSGQESKVAAGKENTGNLGAVEFRRYESVQQTDSLLDRNERISPSKPGKLKGCGRQSASPTGDGVTRNDSSSTPFGWNESNPATQGSMPRSPPGGEIDISRIKIDGWKCTPRPRPRPHSAPSARVSSNGCSRLSRTYASSYLAGTVSQLLSEVTKRTTEQLAAEDIEATGAPYHAMGSEITRADDRISTVRRNAETLQASMWVKRTSYLKGSRPHAMRWFPHETDFPSTARPHPRPGKGKTSGFLMTARERKRPHTAKHWRGSPSLWVSPNSPPLLSASEAAFVFGNIEGKTVLSNRPASVHQTTPGRMLQRAASGPVKLSPRQQSLEHFNLSRRDRPWSADMGSRTRGESRGNVLNEGFRSRTSTARPSSAPLIGRERTKSRYSVATSHGVGRHAYCLVAEPPGKIAPFAERKGSILAMNPSARINLRVHLQTVDSPIVTGRVRGISSRRSTKKAVSKAVEAAFRDSKGDFTPHDQFVNARQITDKMKRTNTRYF